MTETEIKKALDTLFVPRDTPLEGVCFRTEDMKPEGENYVLYKAVSSAQHDSGLTHDFSYDIANRAVDILTECKDWEDSDAISEAVDASVPVYTSELMEIYRGDSWAVDEAVKELGSGDMESDKRAALGWYTQIETMVNAIKSKLEMLID